jgi:hypothetical protein
VLRHLIRGNPGLRIEAPKLRLEVPVVLHFPKQPFYIRLNATVVDAVVAGARPKLGP